MNPSQSATPSVALFAVEPQALLALADGTLFRGRAIGAIGHAVGEVVFNTSMTGYREILTDPSYSGQIVTLTYPHVGNVGVNSEDAESRKPFAAGLVIRDLPRRASSWRAAGNLSDYLRESNIVGIADHRHAEAHAHPAREGRAERLHRRSTDRERCRRRGRARPCARRAVDGRARSRQGRFVRRRV
jgi:hypothetical protein